LTWIKDAAALPRYRPEMSFHLAGHLAGMAPPLGAFAAWCGAPPHAIPSALFLTGLVGGLAHCGPMCGPFVLAQTAGMPSAAPVLGRLAGGLLVPYHLGRLTTYTGLGAFAAAVGAAAAALAPLRLGVAALLLAAALLFAAQAAARLLPSLSRRWSEVMAERWAGRLARLSRPLLGEPTPPARFALGLVLGLLPCGFLYGALAAAAATQSTPAGAAAMAAFGLGTVPSLMLVGIGGAACAARWRSLARRAVAPLFLFNAVLLSSLALSLASPG
jgi:uncharacterized protein